MKSARTQDFNAFADEYLFRPYDCVRLMLMAYSDVTGMSEQTCTALGKQFRTGMGYKGTCGALTASLMVLGQLGVTEPPAWLVDSFKHACGSCECADIMPVGGRDFCLQAVKAAYGLMVNNAELNLPDDFRMADAFKDANTLTAK